MRRKSQMKSKIAMCCLICGKSNINRNLSSRNFKSVHKKNNVLENDIFTTWKNECVRATCQILFRTHSDSFVDYFQNANYCSSCMQVIRDIGFTWKQIQSFQKQMCQLYKKMCNLFVSNYEQMNKRSEENDVKERVYSFLHCANFSEEILNYSLEEMVEIINDVTPSQKIPHSQADYFGPETPNTENQAQQTNCNYEVTSNLEKAMASPGSIYNPELKIEPNSDLEENNFLEISPVLIKEESKSSFNEIDPPEPTTNKRDDTLIISTLKENKSDSMKNCFVCAHSGCELNFDTKQRMLIHLYSAHNLEKPHVCPVCPQKYIHKHNLTAHILRMHDKTLIYPFCNFCGKKYENEDDLTLHYSTSHQEPHPFQCAFCPHMYKDRQCLTSHTRKCHPGVHKDAKKMISCSHCNKKFGSKKTLTQHITFVHEKEKLVYNYECNFCGTKYTNENDLNLHYTNAHKEPNPFECAFCSEYYTNREDLINHTKNIHPDPKKHYNSICDICGKGFASFTNLKYHRFTKHDDKKNFRFQCSICHLKFPLQNWLNNHMEKHDEPSLECGLCGKVFQTTKQINHHKNYFHKEGGHKCNFCDETVETKGQLTAHNKLYHKEKIKKFKSCSKPYECKFCAKGYKEENDLNGHYNVAHKGPNPFSCAFCPEFFSNSVDLQRHVKIGHPDPETLVGQLKCKYCDGYFANKRNLQRHHALLHGGTKRFKCKLCSARFHDSLYLKRHLLSHAEGYSIMCETCGMGFKSIEYLKTHSKLHDQSAKNVKCKVCDKTFFNRQSCKQHEVTHTDIKEHTCQECGRGFNNKGNLSEHIKIHYREID